MPGNRTFRCFGDSIDSAMFLVVRSSVAMFICVGYLNRETKQAGNKKSRVLRGTDRDSTSS